MVWWAAALFLAGGCTLGVAAGGIAEWLEMRGEWDKGYQEGRLRGHDLCEAEDDPAGGVLQDVSRVGRHGAGVVAAVLAAVVLRARNSVYRRMSAAEEVDFDHDGIPDVYGVDRPDT